MALGAAFTNGPASAQETVTYTYDARGRLVKVDHGTTGPNANVTSNYTYDAADNRTNVAIEAPLRLSPTNLPNGTAGSAYSSTISASGGSGGYTYQATSGSLPAGLALNGTTGVLSGTPTTAGSYAFTITATDSSANTGSQSYNLAIDLSLSPTTLPAGTVGTAYSKTITAGGGTGGYAYQKSSGTLPTGLALNGSTGVLSGTPTTAATYSFSIAATDSSGNTGSRNYSVAIGSGATIIQLTSANHNLRTVANANGYTGSATANYKFIVGSGVTITGASGGGAGVDTGTWPSGVTLALTVNGIVRGGGGNGGKGGGVSGSSLVSPSAGGAGGDAVQCHAQISITVAAGASLQAGGGGGGGGAYAGENPGGTGPGGYNQVIPGGGGGGGAPNGAGGAGGAGYNTTTGTAGSPGTTSGGGAAGTIGYPGGAGGTYGATGAAGATETVPGGAGGPPGYGVHKNGTACSVTKLGSITGTIG